MSGQTFQRGVEWVEKKHTHSTPLYIYVHVYRERERGRDTNNLGPALLGSHPAPQSPLQDQLLLSLLVLVP